MEKTNGINMLMTIDDGDSAPPCLRMLLLDSEVIKGLYVAVDKKRVKRNIKVFKIDPIIAEDNDPIGARLSSYASSGFAILTLHFREANMFAQFLMTKDVDVSDIVTSDIECIVTCRDLLFALHDHLETKTLADLVDLLAGGNFADLIRQNQKPTK